MLHTASADRALFLIAASAFLQGMPLSELSDEAVRTLLANGFSTRYAYSASFYGSFVGLAPSLTFSHFAGAGRKAHILDCLHKRHLVCPLVCNHVLRTGEREVYN